jgi:hypothetical protein
LAALQTAVDDVQRRDALAALQQRFQKLDARRVCELLAELMQQRERLREERDHLLTSFAAFQELIGNVADQFVLIGGLRHIRDGLDQLEKREKLAQAETDIRDGLERTTRVADLLKQTVQATSTSTTPWMWCDVAALCRGLPKEITIHDSEQILAPWGLYCCESAITESLATLMAFTQQLGASVQGSASLDSRLRLLRMQVDVSRQDFPPECYVFGRFPMSTEIAVWGLSAAQWAKLSAATRQLQGIGATVDFGPLKPQAADSALSCYRLLLKIPVSTRPPGSTLTFF